MPTRRSERPKEPEFQAPETKEIEMETRELTYPGMCDPAVGTRFGPGITNRLWYVVGCLYDPVENQTKIIIESAVKK